MVETLVTWLLWACLGSFVVLLAAVAGAIFWPRRKPDNVYRDPRDPRLSKGMYYDRKRQKFVGTVKLSDSHLRDLVGGE